MSEKCKNCIHIRKLYVPPRHTDIPKGGYVCNLFEEEDNCVMYMNSDDGMCECFTEKEGR